MDSYNYTATDESINMLVMECLADKKVKTVALGMAKPKSHKDPLLTDDKRLDIAFSRLMSQSIFNLIERAPSSASESGCWKEQDIK